MDSLKLNGGSKKINKFITRYIYIAYNVRTREVNKK